MAEPEQRFFESQRLCLSYWDWGNEDRPPLVFVHGRRDHARSWDRVAAAFADDYHVVALDLRGHGDSGWVVGGQYSLPDSILDLVRLIEIVGSPAAVVSHSFGSQISLITAGTYPELVAALVVIDGTFTGQRDQHPEGMGPKWLREWTELVRGFEKTPPPTAYASIADAGKRMVEANPRLPAEMLPALAEHAVRPIEGGYFWKYDLWVHGRGAADIRRGEFPRFWEAITAPVLLIYGADSNIPTAGAELDAQYFKDARARVVANAGHWVHHDQFAIVVDELRTFLGRTYPAS